MGEEDKHPRPEKNPTERTRACELVIYCVGHAIPKLSGFKQTLSHFTPPFWELGIQAGLSNSALHIFNVIFFKVTDNKLVNLFMNNFKEKKSTHLCFY